VVDPRRRRDDVSERATGPATDLPALVALATARDPDAWEAIYRRCHGKLFGFARRRVRDDHAAEDAVSETMSRALHAIDRFTWQGGGFEAWLYGIARNVVRESSRAGGRTTTVSGVSDAACTDRSPEEHVVAGEEDTAMRLAFRRLRADDRELLELRVHAGLSADEVGALLGKRPGAVRMAQARALRRLRDLLEEVRGGR
jgi:RNA polymerase sigma-70 factor (ECF subfamily)